MGHGFSLETSSPKRKFCVHWQCEGSRNQGLASRPYQNLAQASPRDECNFPSAAIRREAISHMAVGQNQWCHFGVGAPPILVSFSGDWDVPWGYDLDFDPWPYRQPSYQQQIGISNFQTCPSLTTLVKTSAMKTKTGFHWAISLTRQMQGEHQ